MLRINISTQPIRLDYNTQNAKLNLQSTPPKVEMERTPATLEIRQPKGELTIDQTPYRYSIGFKNIADFARDNAELGRQTALDTIARIVEEGNQMARFETKTNVIANLAFDASIGDVPEITWAPIAAPKIHYQANPAEINAMAGKVNVTIQPGKVDGDYQPGNVDIQVTQYPSIEFSTIDVKV
ncbi:DUF6470 family protein [Desulfosporosinus sp.]|uniref:DUF6470 family protein n=1 Tax=Desulfosporosinus sp. TaxID=157907 RepID=UPI0025C6F260|nr:DUF6470 family protein [Desulfosporosinus sp.]MBC2723261.1 hypothetical protein [Desulfosporosinus sp.]MBC2727467.1 hypothetical protein [Desulfosporosinus sp.]